MRSRLPIRRRPRFGDFLFLVMDQLCNQGAKTHYMPGGKLKVALPSSACETKGLLKSAIRDDNPVVIIEDKLMYQDKAPVPEEPYLIPLGEAYVVREGRDITLVATSSMVQVAEAAADRLADEGISAEVIDPRSLVPLDEDTILRSVKKTSRAMVIDEGPAQPFHVADLDRLKPEAVAAGLPPQASVLTAAFEWSSFKAFIAWAEEKTGRQDMRQTTLAVFAAAALRAEVRSGDDASLTVSVLSMKAKTSEMHLRDPDLQGLGSLAQGAADGTDARADLALIDLSGTRIVDYRPTMRPSHLSIVIADRTENDAVATLHFCEDDLPLLQAARFLDAFTARVTEPALQLL